MGQGFRATAGVLGALVLVLAAGFGWGAGWATSLWPVSSGMYGSGLSNLFVASILASVGVSALWVAAFDEGRAAAGGALDLAVMTGGPALAGIGLALGGSTRHLPAALVAGLLALLFAMLARRLHRLPGRDLRPLPVYVRIAFGVFVAVLALEGAGLVLGYANVFPWMLSRGNQVIYGFVFLGAMAFFLYALRHPVWGVAGTLLSGFLAYDLVLIGPLLAHLDNVSAARLPSLLAYIATVGGSGLLAAWALFVDPRTRLGPWRLPRPA